MLDLIEIELKRVRKMAEQAGDDFLLYLIDLAIMEASVKARSQPESAGTADRLALTPNQCVFSPKTAPDFRIDVEG